MRTGKEYQASLQDGRDVWIVGEGRVVDVTSHYSTKNMVMQYGTWYDRHYLPEWQDILMTDPGPDSNKNPLAFEIPKTSYDLQVQGRALRSILSASGGNITHTPGYGALIALGLLNHISELNNSREEIEAAIKYRDYIANTGRFLTFSGGGSLIGSRLKTDPRERVALRLVRETQKGFVISGKVQMHTSTPFAEDVLITSREELPPGSGRWLWFIVPVNSPGVRVITRRPADQNTNPFLSPLSSRFDELDASLWLQDVFIPKEQVFTGERLNRNKRHSLLSWLLWHHNNGWLAKAELTLGLSLALTEVMGLKENPVTLDQLTDMMVNIQISRSCIQAAELDPEVTSSGHAVPGQTHLAAAAINIFQTRQKMSEILRALPGSSLVNAPADTDFLDPIMAEELEDAYGGGGYTAIQRSALLQLAWDQVSSALDARESVFELHASGGLSAWRNRLRSWFRDCDDLANGVQQFLSVDFPNMDLSIIQDSEDPNSGETTSI